jgi:hypothetical protein
LVAVFASFSGKNGCNFVTISAHERCKPVQIMALRTTTPPQRLVLQDVAI